MAQTHRRAPPRGTPASSSVSTDRGLRGIAAPSTTGALPSRETTSCTTGAASGRGGGPQHPRPPPPKPTNPKPARPSAEKRGSSARHTTHPSDGEVVFQPRPRWKYRELGKVAEVEPPTTAELSVRLKSAAERGDLVELRKLLEVALEDHQSGPFAASPRLVGNEAKKLQVALDRGCDKGWTSLHVAVSAGFPRAVELLARAEACVRRDLFGNHARKIKRSSSWLMYTILRLPWTRRFGDAADVEIVQFKDLLWSVWTSVWYSTKRRE